ncbi:MAG TPA: hypothetical protein VMB03_24575 [Bryobacteraceae bacterium]|nr:hypothetical protein [Bryobacteraceae bacterium]
MDDAQRQRFWRYVVVIVCAASLAVSAAAFYGIRRLEAKSKPHVHQIREVNQFRVEPRKK